MTRHSSLTPISEALAKLLSLLPRINEHEQHPLAGASGRVLAADLIAPMAVPPRANSAMDGFAVHSSSVSKVPAVLPVTQRLAAGQAGTALARGEAARIFTGAPLPEGADAVVMQENTTFSDTEVTVQQSVAAGENVRPAGEDIAAGVKLFAAGHRLRPQDLAVIASVGMAEIPLVRRLKVALMNTGDELVQPGTPLSPGQIYNSNSYTLAALLQNLGVELVDLGVVGDELEATQAILRDAARQTDCIISTGGVSVGEEDHVKAAVESQGKLDLWKLAIKPGKPFASGQVGQTRFFGLPGNPVSAFVTFVLLVRPCLLAMQGCRQIDPAHFNLPAQFSRDMSGERQEYLRVILDSDPVMGKALKPYENQSSGVAASLSAADGLAIIPPYTAVNNGDLLPFIPFTELLH